MCHFVPWNVYVCEIFMIVGKVEWESHWSDWNYSYTELSAGWVYSWKVPARIWSYISQCSWWSIVMEQDKSQVTPYVLQKSMRINSAIEKRGFLQRNVQIQMFGSTKTSFVLVLKYGVNQECLINWDECCSCLLGLPNGGQTLKGS